MAALSFEKTNQNDNTLKVSFIPLIDIVLQIVCFYLFVSSGVQSYQDAAVELPAMTADVMSESLPAELTVNLTADGALDVNGQPTEMASLTPQLVAAKAAAAAEGQKLVVAIRADRRQRFGVLDQVMQACSAAGVPTVTLRSVHEAAGPGEGVP